MPTDWRALCTYSRIDFEGDDVIVDFENGRKHRVRIRETENSLELHAIVARAGAVKGIDGLPLRVWLRNRATQLVSFRIDTRGRVYAEGWVPKAGITADEFEFVVRRFAAESDRFEFMLTGRDVE